MTYEQLETAIKLKNDIKKTEKSIASLKETVKQMESDDYMHNVYLHFEIRGLDSVNMALDKETFQNMIGVYIDKLEKLKKQFNEL